MTEVRAQSKSAVRPTVVYSRRASRRAPFEARVSVMEPVVADGVTINRSEGGLRVAVGAVLVAGERLTLVVSEHGQPDQLVRARVAWCRELRDGCIAGLEQVGLH
ncbi:MAG: PilZ domain-containing protein [Myxococcota bacterium]